MSNTPKTEQPLIVTLALDAATFAVLNALRRLHFPPERNVLDAHVTLFHALPGAQLDAIVQAVNDECRHLPSISLDITKPYSLGRGVALRIRAEVLDALRNRLATLFANDLTRQDAAPFKAHVTIQNKVEPQVAAALLDEMKRSFAPFSSQGTGMDVWHYRGGPWELAHRALFLDHEAIHTAKINDHAE